MTRWLTLALVLLLPVPALAQATHIISGASLPSVCRVGDIYQKTGASAGIYFCSASNTWTQLTSGGTGTVTHTGALTAGQLVFGNGTDDITVGNLSGDVSTSGSGVTAIGASKVTNTMLAGSITASKLVGTDIATVGTITTGTWNATTIAFGKGGTGLTSAADDTTLVSSGSAWVATTLPNCVDTGGNHLNYTQATNAFSCGTSGGGGGATLDTLGAAAAQNSTRSNGNNYGQVFNWALTSDQPAIVFGETTAATSGTSVQALVGINTLATSTATGLLIQNFGLAPSIKVDDVASDTTSFWLDADGEMAIQCGSSPTQSLQLCGSQAHIDFTDSAAAITMTKLRFLNASAEVGTIGAVDLLFTTDTGTTRGKFVAGLNQFAIVNNNNNTTITTTNLHSLYLYGDGANEYSTIGFGYLGTAAYMGYQESSNAGFTFGDLVFGTKASTASVAPTEQLRIKNTDGALIVTNLKTTGAAGSKNVVCVDTATGQLYASSTGTDCSN